MAKYNIISKSNSLIWDDVKTQKLMSIDLGRGLRGLRG